MEFGKEGILYPNGTYREVGANGPEFVKTLPKGSVVFNHKQWAGIKNNPYVTGKAHFNGTVQGSAYASGTKDSDKFVDWIEILLKRANTTLDRIQKQAELSDSWVKQNNLYDKSFEQARKIQQESQKAYARYMKQAKDLKLDEKYAKQVREGTMDITKIDDDDLRQKITDYTKWFDKAQDAKDAVTEMREELTKISEMKFKSITDYFDAFIDRFEALSDAAEARSDMVEARRGWGDVESIKASRMYLKKELERLQAEYQRYEEEYHYQVQHGKIIKGTADDATARKGLTDIRTEMYKVNAALYDIDKQVEAIGEKHLETIAAPYDSYGEYLETSASRWEAENEYYNLQHGQDSSAMLRKAALHTNTAAFNYDAAYQAYKETIKEELKTGELKKGTVRYTEAYTQLEKYRENAVKARVAVEELNQKIREANWSQWDKGIKTLEHYYSSLSAFNDLLSEFNSVESKTGKVTEYGAAQMFMYANSMKEARQEVAEYGAAMEHLKEEYKRGDINKNTYDTQYMELYEKELASAKKVQESRKGIIETVRKGIEAETSAMEKLIQKRKEALQRQREADNYARSIRDKNKEIAKIQAQITALSGDSTEPTRAKVRKLQADLRDKQEELDDARREHEYDSVNQGLDDELQTFKDTQDEKLEALTSNLAYQDKIIKDALQTTTDDFKGTLETIQGLADEYGITIPDALKKNLGGVSISGLLSDLDSAKAKAEALLSAASQAQAAALAIANMPRVDYNDTNGNDSHAGEAGSGTNKDTSGVQAKTKEDLKAELDKAKALMDEAKQKVTTYEGKVNQAQNDKEVLSKAYNNLLKDDRAYTVNKDSLPFRETASSTGKVLAKLKAGTEVEYTGKSDGNWYQVKYNGKTGWVYKKYLDKVNDTKMFYNMRDSVKDNLDKANSSYNTNWKKMTSAQAAYEKAYANWEKARKAYADYDPATKKQVDKLEKAKADNPLSVAYLTTKDNLPFREEANGKAAIFEKLKKNTTVQFTGQTKGKWYQVKYKGKVGWIHSDYLKPKTDPNNMAQVTSNKVISGLGDSIARFLQGNYAGGTKSARGGLSLTDEEGIGSEAILTKRGVLRQLDAGDMVFNATQRNMLWKLSNMEIPTILNGLSSSVRSLASAGGQNINITNTYGSLITVEGNVDKDVLPSLEKICKEACEYTKKDLKKSLTKIGWK